MNRVVGGSLPADIWREVMLAAHAGRQPATLPGVAALATPPPGASHPQEGINEDFIARALEDSPPGEDDRRPTAVPDGRMSLGHRGG